MASVVRIRNLVKRYGDMLALDHFDLDIAPGEIFGLLGPNGSGKTTAINCILQLLSYDKGEIELFGQPMTTTRYDLKKKIGIVPQQVAVFEELTVRENVDYFCSLYVDDAARRKGLVDEAIAFVELEDYVKFRPKKLSGGLLRRLNIACGIAHKPELIFFDEPTVAVDPQSRAAILEGIRRLNAEGTTVVYTSHYMEEVEQLCTRVMIMDHGRSLAMGTIEELQRSISTGEKIRVDVGEMRQDALDGVCDLPHVISASFEDGELSCACENGTNNLAQVLGVLERYGVDCGRIVCEPPTLNDVFLEITGRELRD
ncbi:MAG: ATP-binding cassette domain-containing protein [Coriobacteriales bacterium]|jgi:ABC-2 type transport system ATP-binding protein